MKRAVVVAGGLAAALVAGCTARPSLSVPNDEVYLVELGPSIIVDAPPAETFRLGAGDALGQGIFARYVVAVRAGQPGAPQHAVGEGDDAEPDRHATGEDDAPSP